MSVDEWGRPMSPPEATWEGVRVVSCNLGYEKTNVLGWSEDWECDFHGEVDAQMFGKVLVWDCPQCGGMHEEEPDE